MDHTIHRDRQAVLDLMVLTVLCTPANQQRARPDRSIDQYVPFDDLHATMHQL